MTEASKAVFLSYASQDAAAAKRICEALQSAGIEVWFDQSELRGGDVWDQAIHHQIRDCALFVPVISAHTQARLEGYFRREWKLAVARTHDMADEKRFLVPVVVDGTSEQDATVPEVFRTVQWTRLPGGDTPVAFRERIVRLLAGPESPAHPKSIPTAVPDVVPRHTSHRWIIVAALGAVIVGAVGWRAWHWLSSKSASGISPVTTLAVPEKSIAVLPFVDMSEKHDQEYFADGMAEEIIERLARVPALHVTARASSFYFKGKSTKLADIARELSVANIVEGSVRKSGEHLRIGAQLVRVADGYTVWSQSFDRQLKDVFRIQDEIATAVASALQITLSGGSLTRERGGTQNLEAYQLYLQGRSNVNENTRATLKTARAQLERAVQIDPDFGLAWSWLSETWVNATDFGDVTPTEGYERARQLATRAIAVSPGLAEPHSVLAFVYRGYDWNWPAATDEVKRALALDSGSSEALMTAGQLAQTLGRRDEAERLLRAALVRDPLVNFGIYNLGNALYLAGHFTEAEVTFRRLLAIAPTFVWTRPWLAKTLLVEGKPQEALDITQPVIDDEFALLYTPVILLGNGRKTEAQAAVQRLISQQGAVSAFYVAQYYAYAGDKDRAMLWLERAYDQKDAGLVDIVGEVLLRNLWGDPRYRDFMRKMKLPET